MLFYILIFYNFCRRKFNNIQYEKNYHSLCPDCSYNCFYVV